MYYFIFSVKSHSPKEANYITFKCFAESIAEAFKKVENYFGQTDYFLIEQGEIEPVYNLPVNDVHPLSHWNEDENLYGDPTK